MDALMLHEMLGDTPTEEARGHFEEKRKRKQKSRRHFAPLERGLMPSLAHRWRQEVQEMLWWMMDANQRWLSPRMVLLC